MNHNKTIGHVLSVDNFRVYIKIDDGLSGAYKSGIKDIYEIARINSYLIIPVGVDRIVALITHVTMKEEIEFDKKISSITLPTSARYISATMLGTIAVQQGSEKFIQGVYNFPALDNPVWYVTEKDLRHIFDDKQDKENIEYHRDYYLPVGISPSFPAYDVKICPDQFFVKHAAILGNTGSGKSCTLTSIIRNLFKYDYNSQKLENAHFIIFDTNGEYRNAFLPEKKDNLKKEIEQLNLINAYFYGGDEKVNVPYWFMDWMDFKSLLRPGEGSQAPVLNRAIGLAKNHYSTSLLDLHPRLNIQNIRDIINQLQVSAEEYWKIKNYQEVIDDLKSQAIILLDKRELSNILSKIPSGNSFDKPRPSLLSEIVYELEQFANMMEQENLGHQIINEQNIDLPIWFSYQELCTKFIDAAIKFEGNSSNKINEYLSTLRLRMNSFMNDKRMAIPLMLKDNNGSNRNILEHFISFILGDFNRFYQGCSDANFLKEYNDKNKPYSAEKTSQITIIDLSLLPYEVLETITSLLGRLIIEFVSYFAPEERGKYPIVVVLEEAQNYIAENNESVSKAVFERIAREGRKYGISLIVCSQRPSELSKTVLSQCNSFIIHRLQNPDDQRYVKGLVSSANADILDQLPIIPQQHAIITGNCVRTPIQVRINDVMPTPNSNNPKYIERWLKDLQIPYKETCNRWLKGNDNKVCNLSDSENEDS